MAVPPDGGGSGAREGYYPDPSIPGYVRYWNGASWVPGTSRPAPAPGEAPPTPPTGAAPAPAPALASAPPAPVAPAEETGPVFLDEPDAGPAPAAQGQQPTWRADAAHQSGFGGDQDRLVSWGRPVDPRGLPEAADPRRLPDPRRPEAPQPLPPVAPAPHQQRLTGAVPPAAVDPAPARAALPAPARPTPTGYRDVPQSPPVHMPAQAPAPAPIPPQPQPPQSYPQPQPQPPAHSSYPGPGALGSPMSAGAGGGATSWAQQVHQLAQPEPQEPVVPWKPPVVDPFLQAAQAQAAARPAGLGRRLAARLVDTVLLGSVVAGFAVPLITRAGDHIQGKIDAAKLSGRTVTVYLLDGTTAGYAGIVLGAFLLLGLLYEALPTAKWGRTLGKKLCGVQVRGIESYEPPTFGQAVRRWLVYGVLGLLAVGVVNVLWCLFDRPWRQCWHDKAAHTFVAEG
ncbi:MULTISPECIES: RDD family protein [unclassified Streptomyces]|uniref:RDD family protein n=1 Tax=unclassified Streptomyces TaxID=2593676 RepID=UPI0037FE5DA9